MPAVVDVPKIVRTYPAGVKRGSKYVTEEGIIEAAALLLVHAGESYIGELIEPVGTVVKARIAAARWKEALSEHMELDPKAFRVRVYTLQPDVWTFAIAIKQGVIGPIDD